MKSTVPYEDAIDLLDAEHKMVKMMFIDYHALCEDAAPAQAKRALADRICQALTVHAQIEEDIFYPAVRDAIGDDTLMDEALAEHVEAKRLIARISGMDESASEYDATVKELGKAIDEHVLEEREEIFLQARHAALDLRALAVPLYQRQKELKKAPAPAAKEVA